MSLSHQDHGVRVRLNACTKTYKQQRVLEPTDLHIEAGETLVAMDVDGAKARDKSGAVDDGGKSASTAKSGKEGK